MTRKGLLALLLLPALAGAEIRLGEIFYDPIGTDSGLEWIEIHNLGTESRHLGGWLLDAGGPNLILPPIDLPAGAVLLVHTNASQLQAPDGLEIWFQNSTGMGNTHGFVGLWMAEQQTEANLVDYMEYGSSGHSWSSQANSLGVWPAETFAPDVEEGHSLLRIATGNDASDWEDEDQPLPGAGTTAVGDLVAPGVRLEQGLPVLHWSYLGLGERFEIRAGEQGQAEQLLGVIPCRESPAAYSFVDADWSGGDRRYHLDVRHHSGRVQRLAQDILFRAGDTSQPGSTRLLGAYPNPFNPGTLLSFELAEPGRARLGLHDLLGRQVRSLELGELSAGSHTLPLELDGQAGGLYFAVLEGPSGRKSVMKLVLAR